MNFIYISNIRLASIFFSITYSLLMFSQMPSDNNSNPADDINNNNNNNNSDKIFDNDDNICSNFS